MKKDYRAIESKVLSKPDDIRYVIVSNTTGELLDDARGYGYRSKVSAYKSYGYICQDEEAKKRFNAKKQAMKDYCNVNDIFQTAFCEIVRQVEKSKKIPSEEIPFVLFKKIHDSTVTNPECMIGFTLEDLDRWLLRS